MCPSRAATRLGHLLLLAASLTSLWTLWTTPRTPPDPLVLSPLSLDLFPLLYSLSRGNPSAAITTTAI